MPVPKQLRTDLINRASALYNSILARRVQSALSPAAANTYLHNTVVHREANVLLAIIWHSRSLALCLVLVLCSLCHAAHGQWVLVSGKHRYWVAPRCYREQLQLLVAPSNRCCQSVVSCWLALTAPASTHRSGLPLVAVASLVSLVRFPRKLQKSSQSLSFDQMRKPAAHVT